jgi:hypothetical protein
MCFISDALNSVIAGLDPAIPRCVLDDRVEPGHDDLLHWHFYFGPRPR